MLRKSVDGFTLLELSVVVLILTLLAAAGVRYASAISTSNNIAATNNNLNVVETALYNFRAANGRLPCPADITMAEYSSGFGVEVESSGDGLCTGMNFINWTDPDGTSCGGSCDPGAPDANFDATSSGQVVGGAVPTKALRLADKYAYDSWGRKIFYAVDKRFTAFNAFTTYPIYSTTTVNSTNVPVGYVVVKLHSQDALSSGITRSALYALVSTGPNGHGGYVRLTNPGTGISACNMTSGNTYSSGCAVPFNYGSTNTDELANCHCDSSASPTAFNRIFVQNTPNTSSGGSTGTMFDDIVRFKTRAEMGVNSELQ